MRITPEWAKQIAFDAFGHDLDFVKMRVVFSPPGHWSYLLPIPHDLFFVHDNNDTGRLDTEEVKLNKWADLLNYEITRIGYGPRTNTLVVGETSFIPMDPITAMDYLRR